MSEMTLISAAILLWLVMDPLGNVPLFLSALRNVPEARQRWVIFRELLFALIALLLFLFFGSGFMRMLNLSQEALGVAGGVILLLIALRMIFPSREHGLAEPVQSEPYIVPLAIPYVAGPSSLALVLLLMSQQPDRWLEWTGAVLLAWGACLPIMLSSTWLRQRLGDRGLTAMERLMGLILVTIAVEMLLSGTINFLHSHGVAGTG